MKWMHEGRWKCRVVPRNALQKDTVFKKLDVYMVASYTYTAGVVRSQL